ncbi:hypothetical protein D9M71_530750 [compost metagenome]
MAWPSRPVQGAVTGQPVSVCHQWSYTGLPVSSSSQFWVLLSSFSPARNSLRSEPRSYLRHSPPSGSSLRIARNAVGAQNRALTLCSSIIRQ